MGSIPGGVIGIFQWHNPSGRTMALGSTQPLTEMSTRCISWGVKAAGAKGWQPYHHPVPLSWNLGTLTSWNPLGHSRTLTGLLYIFIYSTTNVVKRTLLNVTFISTLPALLFFSQLERYGIRYTYSCLFTSLSFLWFLLNDWILELFGMWWV